MIELTVLCEGPTEVGFVNQVLKPHLPADKYFIKPIPLTKKNFGVVPWKSLFEALHASLGKARRHEFTTCMIDLYALPQDYFKDVLPAKNKLELVRNIEQGLREKLRSPQWIPYIQLHEFESLIYVDLDMLEQFYPDARDISICLRDLRSEIGDLHPEEINDGPDSAPSKRLRKHFPLYGKASAGPAILEAIGLTKLRENCPHFNDWITKLEALA